MKGGGGGSLNYSRPLAGATGGGNLQDGYEECLKIKFEAVLKKLQSKIQTLNIGDVLQLDLEPDMQLVNALSDGFLCGTLDAPQVIQLRICMKKGYKFKATIVELDSNSCRVVVQNLISIP